jgi:glycerophosphoryl diester phosphodiesterase
VSSFSHHRLLRLRAALGPEAATGATWREALAILRVPGGGRYLSWAWSRHQGVPAAVQVPPRAKGLPLLTRGSVAAAHERGLHVHAWVINDADEMARLVGYGVDGIVTDVPSLALKVIAAARDEG